MCEICFLICSCYRTDSVHLSGDLDFFTKAANTTLDLIQDSTLDFLLNHGKKTNMLSHPLG